MIGFASGEIPRLPLTSSCSRAATSAASTMASLPWPGSPKPVATTCPSCSTGRKAANLSVHIHAKYALEEYQKAFEAISKRKALGKTLF